jgi:putative spermidine/putrescine transport system permease protein
MNTPLQPTAMIGAAERGGDRHGWRRARRKASVQALLLALPLLVFLLATFIAPIASLLARSVQNPEVRGAMPQLTAALRAWDGSGAPGEPAFAALGQGLRQSAEAGELGNLARRMNFYQP